MLHVCRGGCGLDKTGRLLHGFSTCPVSRVFIFIPWQLDRYKCQVTLVKIGRAYLSETHFSNVWTLHNPPLCLYLRLTSTQPASYKSLIKTRHHSVVGRREEARKRFRNLTSVRGCVLPGSGWKNSGLKKQINWLERRSQSTGAGIFLLVSSLTSRAVTTSQLPIRQWVGKLNGNFVYTAEWSDLSVSCPSYGRRRLSDRITGVAKCNVNVSHFTL